MFWKLLADGIAIVHVFWTLAFLFGPLLAWKRPRWRVFHLGLIAVTAVAWSYYCPLTVFENMLRARYSPGAAYQGGFLEHYLRPVLNLQAHGAAFAWGVRIWAVAWGIVYAVLWAREAQRNGPPPPERARG